jgi:hypothetical protein
VDVPGQDACEHKQPHDDGGSTLHGDLLPSC